MGTASTAAAVALVLALASIGGCAGPASGNVPNSHVTFERTYDIALAAMADQRMVFSEQNRRQGRIVGTLDGNTIVASITPVVDGTTRVEFKPQGDSAAAAALLKQVTDAYNARMAKLSLLGGSFDTNQKGPVPCPSGPAFCP